MPTDDEYRQLYEMHYFSGPRSAEAPRWLDDYPAVPYVEALTDARICAYRARLERLAAMFPRRGTLLDVGMATGHFAAMAMEEGWKVCGLDVSVEACRLAAARGIEAHCGSLSAISFLNRQFDVVHLHHVFEHFTEPRVALSQLVELLGTGSLLVLEVPSQFKSWTRRVVNSIRLATGGSMNRSVLSIHHPYFYCRETITSLLRDHRGLELVWCRTHFPERWTGPLYRQALRLIDFVADRAAGQGENIEVAARLCVRETRGTG